MDKMNSCVNGRKVVCRNCGTEMLLDDIDFNFRGNQNEYWICKNCNSSFFIKIRYGKEVSRVFSLGEYCDLDDIIDKFGSIQGGGLD